MAYEHVEIEDEAGNVIGHLDAKTMRVVAPNRRVDQAIESGESIYMRRNGIRSILTPEKPKRRR